LAVKGTRPFLAADRWIGEAGESTHRTGYIAP
jgi:hypothetical protein